MVFSFFYSTFVVIKIGRYENSIENYSKRLSTICAGVDKDNVLEQLAVADGAIVGSCFKPYKRTQEKVSRELVKEFMNKLK